MKNVLEELKSQMTEAFKEAGFTSDSVEMSISRRPELCDFQCSSALKLAKAYDLTPMAMAEKVAAVLNQRVGALYTAQAQNPGFINVVLGDMWLSQKMNIMLGDDKLGCEAEENPKKIMVDFGGANVAKALHVGHLRSAVIGESLVRILRYKGHDVTGDIHLGDWGLQMGLVMEMLRSLEPELPYFSAAALDHYPEEPPFDIEKLTQLYTKANIKSKEDSGFRDAAAETTAALQHGHAGYRALWKHILNVSVADLRKNYGALQVTFDLWLGESDSQDAIPAVMAWLENRQLLETSDGAKVVYVEEETDNKPMPPCIIQKANGAILYGATDLATLYQRMRDYAPDEVLYVVDKRQGLHFEQVFRVAYKSEIVPKTTKLHFIGFGTMNGSDGKPFKTRDGGVMALQDLIEQLIDGASQRLTSQQRYDDEKVLETIALAVGVGALKFGDLSNLPERDYVFDLDQFASFEGKTGPYIQYAAVRIASILAKLNAITENQTSSQVILEPDSDAEKKLMLKLSMFGAWVDLAASSYQPSKICDFAFELCQTFNHFYHEVHILSEPDQNRQQSYGTLLKLTQKVIVKSLELLGIASLEQM